MPSKTVFKSARESAYRDDPLAELSRIMGLNEEARRQAEAGDDFGIDLEQELMGDLSGVDQPAAANTSTSPASPVEHHAAIEDALASEIDSAFDEMFAGTQQEAEAATALQGEGGASPVAFASAGPEPEPAEPEPEMSAEPHLDDEDLAAFDAAIADIGTAEQTSAAPAQAAAAEPEAASAGVAADADSSLEDELRGLLADEPEAEAAIPAAALDDVQDFDDLPPFDEAAFAADLAADEAPEGSHADDQPVAAAEDEPSAASGEERAAWTDEGQLAEAAFADELISTFDAADFSAEADAGMIDAQVAEPEFGIADQDEGATAAIDAETAPGGSEPDEAPYADEPAALYTDEPVDYAEEPAAYSDESAAYADSAVAYADEPAADAGEPLAVDAITETREQPGDYASAEGAVQAEPMLGEIEEPLLDAADFGEFEDGLVPEEVPVDLEAPAEDDVEAFATEPGEWLAAEPAEDAPLADRDAAAEPEGFGSRREWQPLTQDAAQPVSDDMAGADYGNGGSDGADEGAFDDAVDLAAFEAELSEIAAGEEFPGEPVAGAADAPAWQALEPEAAFEDMPAAADRDATDGAEEPDIALAADFAEDEPAPRAEEKAREAEPQPASADADDPFAALAAMAAAPPILKTFSRTNPVAVNPAAERPGAAQPSAQAEEPRASEPAPQKESYFSIPRRLREAGEAILRPVEAVRSAASAAPATAPASGPVAPVAAGTVAATPPASGPRPAAQRPAPEAPEVDTVEVAENHVPVADELDIPDLPSFGQETATASNYDEFDNEFADAFQQLQRPQSESSGQVSTPTPVRGFTPAAHAADVDFQAALEADLARIDAVSADFGVHGIDDEAQRRARNADLDDDYEASASHRQAAYADDDAYAAGQGFAGDADAAQDREPHQRRGLLIAAAVAGVALLGGVGAFALSFGGGDDGPALVRADPGPVKVKPENPGGVVVPNQDGKVYERVAGEAPGTPEQEKLVTTVEEPIEPVVQQAAAEPAPAAQAPTPATTDTAPSAGGQALPGVEPVQIKSDDRVIPEEPAEAASAGNEIVAVAPRKVRTMIVRPDGTLVPRPEPEPEQGAAAAEAAQPATTDTAGAPQTLAAAQPDPAPQVPNAAEGAGNEISILPADAQNVTAPSTEEASAGTPVDPQDVIVPQPRPSHQATAEAPAASPEPAPQPRAEPAQTQVASAPAAPADEPEPAAAATASEGLWQVQIASQPSREGAQASYEEMARRYASVLGGKPVNIVQADIPNKGTFWRVRIPAASKSDANILCAKLKTAGGNCFVSK